MHSTMVRNEMAWDKGWPRLYMWGQTLWALEDFNQMTTKILYLIAHKVRGEPAFDVAIRMECPICHGVGGYKGTPEYEGPSCTQCEGDGYWWIIPTSGHRAYPYWSERLEYLVTANHDNGFCHFDYIPEMSPSLPDHYAANDRALPEPSRVQSLKALVAPALPTPSGINILRRQL